MHSLLLAAGALCLLACGGSRQMISADTTPQPSPAATSTRDRSPATAPATTTATAQEELDPATLLSEAAARSILARRFRAAGLRVRYDVLLTRPGAFDITVDGYDPARKVGFEYVDAAERDTDLHAAERDALARDPEHRVLVVDAIDAAGLDVQITRFLAQPRALTDRPDRDAQ